MSSYFKDPGQGIARLLGFVGIATTFIGQTPWGLRIVGLGALIWAIQIFVTGRMPRSRESDEYIEGGGAIAWGVALAVAAAILILGAGKIVEIFLPDLGSPGQPPR